MRAAVRSGRWQRGNPPRAQRNTPQHVTRNPRPGLRATASQPASQTRQAVRACAWLPAPPRAATPRGPGGQSQSICHTLIPARQTRASSLADRAGHVHPPPPLLARPPWPPGSLVGCRRTARGPAPRGHELRFVAAVTADPGAASDGSKPVDHVHACAGSLPVCARPARATDVHGCHVVWHDSACCGPQLWRDGPSALCARTRLAAPAAIAARLGRCFSTPHRASSVLLLACQACVPCGAHTPRPLLTWGAAVVPPTGRKR